MEVNLNLTYHVYLQICQILFQLHDDRQLPSKHLVLLPRPSSTQSHLTPNYLKRYNITLGLPWIWHFFSLTSLPRIRHIIHLSGVRGPSAAAPISSAPPHPAYLSNWPNSRRLPEPFQIRGQCAGPPYLHVVSYCGTLRKTVAVLLSSSRPNKRWEGRQWALERELHPGGGRKYVRQG